MASSGGVVLRRLGVRPARRGLPLVPAWPWLGDLPARRLLDLVARAAAGPGIATTGAAALVVGDGVLEVALFSVAIARRERAGVIADLN